MPNNISTNFNEFVNENLSKKTKVTKQEIKDSVLECLSKSENKLSLSEISRMTGHKTDNVYVALISIKEAKSKKCGDILRWYIDDNQKDPIIVKKVVSKGVDPILEQLLKNDDPNNRKVFLNHEDLMQYNNPEYKAKKVRKRKK